MKKIITLLMLAALLSAPIAQADAPSDEMLKSAMFLMKMRQEFSSTRKNFSRVSESMLNTYEELRVAQERSKSIRAQITEIDAAIKAHETRLQQALMRRANARSELETLKDQIAAREDAVSAQEKFVADYAAMLFVNGQTLARPWNILLVADSTAAISREQTYALILTETAKRLIENLTEAKNGFEILQQEAREKEKEYDRFTQEILQTKEELESEKRNKVALLKATHGQEKAYQDILREAHRVQEDIFRDIQTLRRNLKKIEEAYAQEGKFDELKKTVDDRLASIFALEQEFAGGNETFSWPVSPAGGLSAYFRDGSYQKRFGIAHNAIDIRVLQHTPVRTPMDGIVFKTHADGKKYSYVILAHADGFMTVYGHLSEIFVKEGQKVTKGELIAYSGGMPGTEGAGFMTTGPHLHFEMLKEGAYVDPLFYLPLAYLPLDDVPEKYRTFAKEQKETESGKKLSNEELLKQIEENRERPEL